jgi:hypothetical protein
LQNTNPKFLIRLPKVFFFSSSLSVEGNGTLEKGNTLHTVTILDSCQGTQARASDWTREFYRTLLQSTHLTHASDCHRHTRLATVRRRLSAASSIIILYPTLAKSFSFVVTNLSPFSFLYYNSFLRSFLRFVRFSMTTVDSNVENCLFFFSHSGNTNDLQLQ